MIADKDVNAIIAYRLLEIVKELLKEDRVREVNLPVPFLAEKDLVLSHPPTLCCHYRCRADVPYPVMWNPFNKVVQCHNCGQVYVPK